MMTRADYEADLRMFTRDLGRAFLVRNRSGGPLGSRWCRRARVLELCRLVRSYRKSLGWIRRNEQMGLF